MNSKEDIFLQMTHRFNEAIYGLRDSGLEGIEDIAGRVVPRITRGEIQTAAPASGTIMPAATSFYMHEIPGTRVAIYTPIILIDPSRMMGSSLAVAQADLVRTISVADQYPHDGFQKRLRDVYAQALERQRFWLEQQNAVEVEHDPRSGHQEEILFRILGEDYYYTDFGWDDWLKAAETISNLGGHTEHQQQVIEELRGSMGHFLGVREKFIPEAHSQAMKAGASKYLEMSQDQRAEAAATVLFGISVYARMPEN